MSNQKTGTVPINKGQFTLEPPERAAEFEMKRGFGHTAEYADNRRKWAEYPKRQYVSEYPLHVDLELASICNLRCPMCYTISPEFRKHVNAKLMEWDLFTRLVDQCVAGDVYSIRLSLRGESFLHPRFVDCVRYAKSAGIKEVSTLTNGLRLDEEMFEELIEAGIDWITISFDGLGEDYEKIRRPAKFDEAVRKIAAYARIKAERGLVKPVIKIQTILPAIEKNPEEFYEVFRPICDMVSANPLIDFFDDKSTLPKIPDFVCPQIYERLVIGADGTAMMCANDESQHHPVGDANTQTIHQIWHGPKLTDIRAIHKAHRGCKDIHACGQCYLPIQTRPVDVPVGDRAVSAEKYLTGRETVKDLGTPDRFKRNDLNV
jgi:sulfatase maturation enzyme AslB (radical SAM superfamily)